MAYDTTNPFVVADAAPADRAQFYRRTYAHVAGAFVAWAALLAVFFATPIAGGIMDLFISAGSIGRFVVMLGLCFATTIAQTMSFNASKGTQYAGLGLAILVEALLFVPLIFLVVLKFAHTGGDANALGEAISSVFGPALLTTGLLIAGLTTTVFMTNKDFSFLRTAVTIGCFVAIGVVIAAFVCGISLGFWFSAAMVLLMGAAILYKTWEIKNIATPGQYVGAATSLFVAFVTLLWYVIQLFSSRSRD
jgi:FtsH-binding integral membrane protein